MKKVIINNLVVYALVFLTGLVISEIGIFICKNKMDSSIKFLVGFACGTMVMIIAVCFILPHKKNLINAIYNKL